MNCDLSKDDRGFIPILVGLLGAGLISALGLSWIFGNEDLDAMIKVYAVAIISVIAGIFILASKWISISMVTRLLIGMGCLGFAGYIVYIGRIPEFADVV